MIVYLDTSIVLRVVLGQVDMLKRWRRWDKAYTSELLTVEARRVLERLRLEGVLDDAESANAQRALLRIEAGLGMIQLSRAVLNRARQPMGAIVGTLDALHLATAVVFRDARQPTLIFATHDRQQANAALALGFECIGVEATR